MGDPRRLRKKYSGPAHPWQLSRLEEEKKLVYEYGLKTKTELWKFSSKLRGFTSQAKRLIALRTEQSQLETKQLLDRLTKLGILKQGAVLGDVLGLTVGSLLDRRLQTVVYKRKLARSANQARQFIVHGHIQIGNKIAATPSHLVTLAEEASITFVTNSTLANEEHPERTIVKKAPEKEKTERKPRERRNAGREKKGGRA